MDTTSEALDATWMARGASKDLKSPPKTTTNPVSTSAPTPPIQTKPAAISAATTAASHTPATSQLSPNSARIPTPISDSLKADTASDLHKSVTADSAIPSTAPASSQSLPSAAPASRSSLSRRNSASEKNGNSLRRTSSWFSNISNKFSSTPNSPTTAVASESPSTKANDKKAAVLPTAIKPDGDAPYTPAPVKSPQAGFMGVLRRFSQTSNFMGANKGTHGIVERRTLNIDKNRERCGISELQQAKLRRVAFCVDVEIAPMPKYLTSAPVLQNFATIPSTNTTTSTATTTTSTSEQKSLSEKTEGEVFKKVSKTPQSDVVAVAEATAQKAKDSTPTLADPQPQTTLTSTSATEPSTATAATVTSVPASTPATTAATEDAAKNKKKEKKKRTEEERKARREKRKRLAEANGQIPLELHLESSSEDEGVLPSPLPVAPGSVPPTVKDVSPAHTSPKKPKTTPHPTTNPVRIYRRCCQLRETPILKRITEQLTNPDNCNPTTGAIEKLDFTGFYLQMPDFITLGDYLAVVPVKEIILENCGLTDESLRMILAGLLAVRLHDPRRRRHHHANAALEQGGVVERVVLSNNKIGPEGWKHICLFICMCRSLQHLDVSHLKFPKPAYEATSSDHGDAPRTLARTDTSLLLARAIRERLAGCKLELLNLGATYMSPDQLGCIVDGALLCGVKRLGLSNNNMTAEFIPHVTKLLASAKCSGLDLGSNDLREHIGDIMEAVGPESSLNALSLANCSLEAKSLAKVLPPLVPLKDFRFLDLTSNTQLFRTEPSALPVIRRYLSKMTSLKRIHLADVGLKPEQAIMLAEILPEVHGLAHITLRNNPLIQALSDARTEADQEEACALYASLLAAARISHSLICVDIETPTENSSEVVKAIAQQVVAYCLRNLARVTMSEAVVPHSGSEEPDQVRDKIRNPEVLAHLVGHNDVEDEDDNDGETSQNSDAPDDDYVIGGTGVVKALQACLNSRANDMIRQSGEFSRDSDAEAGKSNPDTGKAGDVTKFLLASARKIRARLQPALDRAQCSKSHDMRRLMFLKDTLSGIIERFEDEFPETRASGGQHVTAKPREVEAGSSGSTTTPPGETASNNSDNEADVDADDETSVHVPTLSRSSSMIFQTSREYAEEEGRVLRAGHQFRTGILRKEHYDLFVRTIDDISEDSKHSTLLHQLITDVDDGELNAIVAQKGVVKTFVEERTLIMQKLRDRDPEYWDRFVESQEKARANVNVADGGKLHLPLLVPSISRDSAVSDEAAVSD
ncbi:hypothetical protein TD95_004639 [Thielaviopsis punctulata]|uniref:Cell wall biogenesis protein Mhp1 n=1 Tax=Thielaviopsis punctulata TaxID=72032 RepID=A0A0F4ZM53_9PEZI|nr:hypothetical protein TD95_004639 [Thielaviopsis punctulata]